MLDQLISKFPRGHSLPFRVAHFRNGLSVYLKSALSSKKKMGVGTSGLGSMRFQDMPSLLIQMMICTNLLIYVTTCL